MVALILIGIVAFVYADLIFPYTGVLLTWLAGVSAGVLQPARMIARRVREVFGT